MPGDQTVRLIVDMGPSATNIGEAEQKLERLGQAATGASNKMSGFGQSALQAGRVVQDFTQGGIAGILNNIEGLSMALGGGAGLAGVMTIVGVAAFLLKDKFKALADVFSEGKDKIPPTTDRMEQLTEAIKKQKEELDDLRKQESLGFFEMEKYREGVRKLAQEEQDLANARAARAVGAYASKADQARAAAFKGAVGEYGGGAKLIEELMTTGGRTQQRAEEMIAEAQKGNVNEIRNILNRTQGFGQFYTSPEEQAQRKARDDVQKRIAQDTEAKNRALQQTAEAEARGPAEAARQQEKAARQKAAADAALTSEVMAAAAPEEGARARAMRGARRDVSEMAQQMGQGTPNAEQTEAMARDALQNMTNGMNAQLATWTAVASQVQKMDRATRQFNDLQQMMMQRQMQMGQSAMNR